MKNGIGWVGWRLLVLAAAVAGSACVLATGEEPVRQPRASAPRPHREDALAAEQQAEVLAFAKENAPDLYERLQALQQDPQRAALLMGELYRLYRHAQDYPPDVRRSFLEKQRLNVVIFRKLREYRQADDKKREDIKNQIQQMLGTQFDDEQTLREYDVKRLTRQLEDLKALLEQQKQNRDGIIADRFNRLVKAPATASRGSGNVK